MSNEPQNGKQVDIAFSFANKQYCVSVPAREAVATQQLAARMAERYKNIQGEYPLADRQDWLVMTLLSVAKDYELQLSQKVDSVLLDKKIEEATLLVE